MLTQFHETRPAINQKEIEREAEMPTGTLSNFAIKGLFPEKHKERLLNVLRKYG